jgi:predicted nucleic acid-binding protein
MEHRQYLMDTNSVIDFLGNKLPASGLAFMNTVIDAGPNVSVITKIELLGYNAPEAHNRTLINFINDGAVFGLTDHVVNATINIRKSYRIKLPDAIICATALVYDLTLITRNVSDFIYIDGLLVIDPHSL